MKMTKTARDSTFAILAVGYVLLTTCFLIYGFNFHPADATDEISHHPVPLALLMVMLIGPPAWFWVEYNYVYKDNLDEYGTPEDFKYTQELTSRVRAAVSALALVVILKK